MLEIEVTGPLTTSTPALYLGAAEAGLGLAYCLEEEVSRQLAEGTLVSVLEPWCPTFVGFSLFYPSRHQLGNGCARPHRHAQGTLPVALIDEYGSAIHQVKPDYR